ncbi:chemotaxis protein CheA [Geobacter sp. OR-1]|uniref:chemotaxis protein CheA n=1 Tax=Geobacter sp. OR-1 TaxID=1266765 RepID=UPI000541DF73|nr:chemotaxis protein CheA [Geobacter sp. OR-1]GAM08192.1 chemotaxis protein CheA [Geobacter sp. OR-1]
MSGAGDTIGKAVKDFLAEAEEIVDQLNNDLVNLGDCADTGDCNPDLLNSIFRGAHSLKGLAGIFGFGEIGELAHNMENLLDSLRLGKINLNPSIMNVLFDAMDLLGNLVRGAGDGHLDTSGIPAMVARINTCANTSRNNADDSPLASLGLSESVLNALTEYEEHRLIENVKKGKSIFSIIASFSLTTFDQELGDLTDVLKKEGEVISTLPSVGSGNSGGIDFEILFGSARSCDEIAAIIDRPGVTISQLGGASSVSMPVATAPVHFEEPQSEPVPVQQSAEAGMTAKSMSRMVRVDILKLDELMNIVGELVLSHSTINELVGKVRGSGYSTLAIELGKAAKGLQRKLNELQKGVMEIRMIPVGQLYEKMSRIVRKIAREQGKKIDLRLFGADTELDKLIIEDISDPMMHIIRNSIDHGIEPPTERVRLGKDEKGAIRLSSFQKGNHVVIEVEDDGRGIDIDRVKNKAIEKGLIQKGDILSEREALELIFLPGFSTSEKVTDVSGRGVGMDVVRNNIAAVSGMVDIETRPGLGSKVIITLPITLAIIKALIISVAGRTYAMPITSVLETILVESREILTVERREVIQLRDMTLPLVRLADIFELNDIAASPELFYVVVVGVAEKRLGIVVDDLIGQQDIVIKSIGETFKGFRGISGAADLGDQRTILVLDVGGIIAESTRGSI